VRLLAVNPRGRVPRSRDRDVSAWLAAGPRTWRRRKGDWLVRWRGLDGEQISLHRKSLSSITSMRARAWPVCPSSLSEQNKPRASTPSPCLGRADFDCRNQVMGASVLQVPPTVPLYFFSWPRHCPIAAESLPSKTPDHWTARGKSGRFTLGGEHVDEAGPFMKLQARLSKI